MESPVPTNPHGQGGVGLRNSKFKAIAFCVTEPPSLPHGQLWPLHAPAVAQSSNAASCAGHERIRNMSTAHATSGDMRRLESRLREAPLLDLRERCRPAGVPQVFV